MSKPKLNGTTIVRDRAGRAHTFGPGDKVPEWAWPRIGAHLWEVAPEGGTVPEVIPTAPEKEPEGEQPAAGEVPGGVALEIPPLVGAGSSAGAWRAYALAAAKARGLNIEIPEDAKRGGIVEALTAAGIPTAPEKE